MDLLFINYVIHNLPENMLERICTTPYLLHLPVGMQEITACFPILRNTVSCPLYSTPSGLPEEGPFACTLITLWLQSLSCCY